MERIHDFIPGDPSASTGAQPLPPSDTELLVEAEQPATDQAEQDRVRLSGRLVYAPRVHTFPNGNTRVTLTIAEHLDSGETVYHNAYATKRYAAAIARRELKKGDLVELAGQRQLVTRKDRAGNERQVPIIYAYGVKPR